MSARFVVAAAASALTACSESAPPQSQPDLQALGVLDMTQLCAFALEGHRPVCRKFPLGSHSLVFKYEELLIADGWHPVQPGYGGSRFNHSWEWPTNVLWFERPNGRCAQRLSFEMLEVEEATELGHPGSHYYYLIMMDDYPPVCGDQRQLQ